MVLNEIPTKSAAESAPKESRALAPADQKNVLPVEAPAELSRDQVSAALKGVGAWRRLSSASCEALAWRVSPVPRAASPFA